MQPKSICALDSCAKEFVPSRSTQIYHQPACAQRASNMKRYRGASAPVVSSPEDRADEILEDNRQRREIAALKVAVRQLQVDNEKLEVVAGVRGGGLPSTTAGWLKKPAKRHKGKRVATVMSILSDTHFDEVVKPSELGGFNAYDPDIAEQRLARYFEKLVEVPRDFFSGVEVEGLVLMLGGDLISGNIHDELVETNARTMAQSIRHWTPRLADGIKYLANHYGQVHVMSVVGNHPRFTKKPRAKLRTVDNADWLIAQMISDRLVEDERITFDIPDNPDAFVKVYDTTFLLTHGDQTTGGSGIGGIWPPVMRMRARKLQRYQHAHTPFDVLVMGHYHQLVTAAGQGLVINGSMIGYNEYAAVNNLVPERPQQALWYCTPEYGVTWQAPIILDRPEVEGWR